MPIDRWLDKEDVEYYSAIKEWNNAICSNMGEPKDYHTKWTKSNRERWVTYNTTYMWKVKKWYKWNLRNRNRLTDIENKLKVTEGERGWRNKLWVVPESSSSSQGCNLKRWTVLVMMMWPLTHSTGLHVYFKLQVLFYTLTKALGQRFLVSPTQIYCT